MCKYDMHVKICNQQLSNITWVHHIPITQWLHTSLHIKKPYYGTPLCTQDPIISVLGIGNLSVWQKGVFLCMRIRNKSVQQQENWCAIVGEFQWGVPLHYFKSEVQGNIWGAGCSPNKSPAEAEGFIFWECPAPLVRWS